MKGLVVKYGEKTYKVGLPVIVEMIGFTPDY